MTTPTPNPAGVAASTSAAASSAAASSAAVTASASAASAATLSHSHIIAIIAIVGTVASIMTMAFLSFVIFRLVERFLRQRHNNATSWEKFRRAAETRYQKERDNEGGIPMNRLAQMSTSHVCPSMFGGTVETVLSSTRTLHAPTVSVASATPSDHAPTHGHRDASTQWEEPIAEDKLGDVQCSRGVEAKPCTMDRGVQYLTPYPTPSASTASLQMDLDGVNPAFNHEFYKL